MEFRSNLTFLGLAGAQLASAWLANRHYRQLAVLSDDSRDTATSVSIVIPARNEAHRLPALLQSLAVDGGVQCEIVVVDDGSEDSTRDVAQLAGVRVVSIPGPPAGWAGKCFACQTGADVTDGEWLLFTDADTVHHPHLLAQAIHAAEQHGAGLVSLLAGQICLTFWERVLLPYAYALYFVGAGNLNRPGGPAVANGQYMLFRRADYKRIGGHASVRCSLIEDVALAQRAKQMGVIVRLFRAEERLQVRMYTDLRTIWEGFSKNASRFVLVSPRIGIPTALATVAFNVALPVAIRSRSRVQTTILLLLPSIFLAPWLRRFGVPRPYAALHPLTSAVFQILVLDSLRRALTVRGTVWKGRLY